MLVLNVKSMRTARLRVARHSVSVRTLGSVHRLPPLCVVRTTGLTSTYATWMWRIVDLKKLLISRDQESVVSTPSHLVQFSLEPVSGRL